MRSKKYLKATLLALFVLGTSVPIMARSEGGCSDASKACYSACTSNDKNSTQDCIKECNKEFKECKKNGSSKTR